jgi:glycosyltransferase involved in cell wall biosynthesis
MVARSASFEKCSVVRNRPDLNIFVKRPARSASEASKFLITYPGTLNAHQGVDVAIRAFASIADQIPEAAFHIYGEGPAKPALIALADQLGMQGRVIFHEFLPSHEIARVMAETDLAIEPKRASSAFGSEALSTKILEFMALGVPIIASRTKIHAYYYSDSILKYYDLDSEIALAECILEMRQNKDLRAEFAKRASAYARENTWQAKQNEYLDLIDSLVAVDTPVASSSSLSLR